MDVDLISQLAMGAPSLRLAWLAIRCPLPRKRRIDDTGVGQGFHFKFHIPRLVWKDVNKYRMT
jgi:hypothetical protein